MIKKVWWALLICTVFLFSSCSLGLIAGHSEFPFLCFLKDCRDKQKNSRKHKKIRPSHGSRNKKRNKIDRNTVIVKHEKINKKEKNIDSNKLLKDTPSIGPTKRDIQITSSTHKDSLTLIEFPLISDSIHNTLKNNPINNFEFAKQDKNNKKQKSTQFNLFNDSIKTVQKASFRRDSVLQNSIIVNFEFDDDKIINKDQIRIKDYIESINFEKLKMITLTGFTDSDGSTHYNKKLSLRRTQKVYNYLKSCGVPTSKLKMNWLGESFPKNPDNTAEGKSQNRRVEIVVE